jgi:hypothetical protein
VELVLRTYSSVFAFVEVWDADTGNLVLHGSMQPWPSNPAVFPLKQNQSDTSAAYLMLIIERQQILSGNAVKK